MAVNGQDDKRFSPKEMGEAMNVPPHFLAKVLQQLSKKKIVCSIKGPGGGFYLSPENLKTQVIEVIYAIDGPAVFRSCILGLKKCSSEKPCPVHFQIYSFREGLRLQFEHQTIGGLSHGLEPDQLLNIEL